MNQESKIETRRETLKKLFKSIGLLGVGATVGASVLRDSKTSEQIMPDNTKETLDYLNDWEQLID